MVENVYYCGSAESSCTRGREGGREGAGRQGGREGGREGGGRRERGRESVSQ